MKLRLPSKLVAAIMAAASSATFATLATGSSAYGSTTYDNLAKVDYFNANENVYNTGSGTFYLETSDSVLDLTLTVSLSGLEAQQSVHDYGNAGYYGNFVTWTYNNAAKTTYGMADISSNYNGGNTVDYNGFTGLSSSGTPWTDAGGISIDTLRTYANGGDLVTLTITNAPASNGVQVTALDSQGVAQTLYSGTGLTDSSCASAHVTTFTVNMGYVKSVTLNSTSTLSSVGFTPPIDYTQPFVSSRTDGTSVGRIMFLGDSITHGVQDMSWRWGLFKTFVDNGIENQIAGPRTTYNSTPLNSDFDGTSATSNTSFYGGALFENRHYAEASGRTFNMLKGNPTSNVFGAGKGVSYSNIGSDQVGQDYNADTYIMMMGTNDILSDGANTDAKMALVTDRLLGQGSLTNGTWTNADVTSPLVGLPSNTTTNEAYLGKWGTMGKIIDNLNMDARDVMYILSIPTWGQGRSDIRVYANFVPDYNTKLEAWTKAYSGSHTGTVKYIDINRGLVDKTLNGTFLAPDAFFRTASNDYIHPNEQGSLIIAGNLAQGMGFAGRTAGLLRADSHTTDTEWFSGAASYTINAGDNVSVAENVFGVNNGYTVDFKATFGNGGDAEGNNWLSKDNALSISVGDGANVGTLNLSEGYISWGSKLLFCQDNSLQNNDTIRIAYQVGDAATNVGSGYYVWLGDMLIGQALTAGSGSLNGITLSATGATGTVSGLTYSNTAYAPTTSLITSAENAFHVPAHLVMEDHNATATTSGIDWDGATTNTAQKGVTAASAFTEGVAKVKLTAVNNWFAAGAVTTTGDIEAKVDGQTSGGNAFAMQGGTLTGNVTMEFSDSTIAQGGYATGGTTQYAAVAGSYGGAKVTKTFSAYINNSTLLGDMVGGTLHGTGSIGAVNFVVNSGLVQGSVYGGSKTAGTVGDGTADAEGNFSNTAVAITINGGTITGSVNGGGTAGTVKGNAEIVLNGGIIRGDVTGGDVQGSSSVTVNGNKVSVGGNISADNVTLQNIATTDYEDAFDKFAGSVTAADTLTLDHYTAAQVGSAVSAQHVVLKGNSSTTIRNLTLTACTITAQDGSDVTLEGTLTLGNTATYTGTVYVADDLVFSMTADALSNAASAYTYSEVTSGFRTVSSATLLTPGDTSRLKAVGGAALTETNVNTYTGAGALAGATFSYNAETGILSAAPVNQVGSGTYYVNDAVTYDTNTPAYAADALVINNGGTLTFNTNLKDNVSVTVAQSGAAIGINEGNHIGGVALADGVTGFALSGAGELRLTSADAATMLTGVTGTGTMRLTQNAFLDGTGATAADPAKSLSTGTFIVGNGAGDQVQLQIGSTTTGGDYRDHHSYATIKSFSSVVLDNGKLWYQTDNTNGNHTVQNLTVTSAGGEIYIEDTDSAATFALNGTTNLQGNLSLISNWKDNKYVISTLTGKGDLITGSNNDAPEVKLDNYADWSGKLINTKGTFTYSLAANDANSVAHLSNALNVNGGTAEIRLGDGTYAKAVHIDAVTLANNATIRAFAHGYDDNNYSTYRLEIDALKMSGAAATLATTNHGSQLSVGSITGSGTLTLTNTSSSTVHSAYILGGAATTEGSTTFSGTVVMHHNNNGDRRGMVVFLNDTYTMANADLQVKAVQTAKNRVLGVGISADHAKLGGLNDQDVKSGGATLPYSLFSATTTALGTQYPASNSTYFNVNDGSMRTLEITGSGTYSTGIRVMEGINLVMSGTGSQTFSGDMSRFNGSVTVNNGTLALTGDSKNLAQGATVNGGTLTISGTATTLGGTITNAGTLNLSGTVAVDTTRLWNYETTGTDAVYSNGENGFLTSTMYLVKNSSGTLVNDATITNVETNIDSGNITFSAADTTTYFVNTDVNYDNAAMGSAANLYIKQGVTLTANANPTSAKTLVGSGTYLVKTPTGIGNVTAGTSDNWTGIVELNNINMWNTSNTNGVNLNTIGNRESWVQLTGVWGIDRNWDTTAGRINDITSNLILENGTGSNNFAWRVDNGGSGKLNTYRFTGDIKGSGTILKIGTHDHCFIFTGDVSGWNGSLTYNEAPQQAPTVKFSGNATVINAAVQRDYTADNKNLTLQLEAPTNGATEYQLNNKIKVDTLSATGQNVVFGRTPVRGANDAMPTFTVTGAATVYSLTVAEDASATLGSLTSTGNTTVEEDASLTVTGTATVNTLTLGAGASMTLTSATSTLTYNKVADAIQLEEGAVLDLSAANAGNNTIVLDLMRNASGAGTVKTKAVWAWGSETDITTKTNFDITGNLYFGSNQANKGVITIGSGTTTKVSDDAHLEGGLTMAVAGTLESARVVMGHESSTTSAGHFVVDGGSIITGSVAAGPAANASTLRLSNGGTLQIKGENMFGSGKVENIALTVENGTLLADGNSWTLNHAAAIGNATLETIGAQTITVSGVLSDMTDTHGSLTKTGEGAAVLGADNTYTGGTTIENGALIATDSAALTNSVVTFADRTAEQAAHRVLAFETGATYDSETGTLTGGTAINGTIAGLSGYRGTVVADTLTINVAEGQNYEFLHRYSSGTTNDAAVLDVNRLVKTGAGTQVIGGEYTTGDGLSIANGVDVQGGSLHMKTRGVVTANFDVQAGATLLTTDDNANKTTAAASVKYDGKVTLHGTAENTATLHYTDGSTNITNGLYVDGYGSVINKYDKNQFIGGLYNATDNTANDLTFTRPDSPWDNTDGNLSAAVITASGNFTGTVHVSNGMVKNDGTRLNEKYGLQVLGEGAKTALAGAVVDFTGDNVSVLSFRNSDTVSTDWTNSKMDGSVAGLTGTNGAVYANGLTINTAAGSNYNYGGTLNITGLTKTGTGTQTLSGTGLSLGTVAVNGGTLALTGTAANMASFDSLTIANNATLDLTGVTDMFVNDAAGNWAKFKDLTSKATGAGTVLLPVAAGANDKYQIMVASNGGNATLSTNYVMNHGVVFNNYNNYSNPGDNTGVVIAEGGSLTVNNGALKLASGMKMTLNGGSLTAHSLILGHGDASQNYFGSLTMNSGAVTLNGQITLANSYAGNALNLQGGTFTYNADGNVFDDDSVNRTAAVTIGGEDAEHKTTLVADGHSWTLNHDATLGHVTVQTANDGAVTIGTADTTTTLTGLIYNKGDLTLEGTVNVVHDMNTQDAYFTNGSDDRTYGYLNSVTMKVIELSSGSSEHINDVTWKLNGQSADWYGLSEVEYSGGLVLMQGPSGDNSKRWFMNTGAGATFEYTGAESQEMNSFIINAKNDAELTLNTGDNVGNHLTGSIIVNDTTASINIVVGTTLGAAKLSTANNGSAVLTGAGTFDLGSVDKRGSLNNPINLTLPDGVSLSDAEHWTGVVSVSGTINWLEGDSLNNLANENSWVEFKGLNGVWNGGDTINANIRFTDNGGEAGYKTSGGFGGYTTTFNGKVSGTGTYYLTNYNGGTQTFKFAGDASAWSGTLKSNNTNATGNQIQISNAFGATLQNEAGNMQVTLSGTALTADAFTGDLVVNSGTMNVNGALNSEQVDARINGGTLNLKDGGTMGSIYSNGTSAINIGTEDGAQNVSLSVSRIELGDMNIATGTAAASTLTVQNNATLLVRGNTNNTNIDGYKSDALIIGEWNADSVVNVKGTMIADQADLLIGDTGNDHKATVNIAGGTLAVKGVDAGTVNEGKNGHLELNVTGGGKLILGADGYYTRNVTWGTPVVNTTVLDGTIGISADDVTVNKDIKVDTMTLDTQKYAVSTAEHTSGNGTINIGGNITVADEAEHGNVSIVGGGAVKIAGEGSMAVNTVTIDNTSSLKSGDMATITHKADSDTTTLVGTTVTATGISKTQGASSATINHADITVGSAPQGVSLLALADEVSYNISDVNLVDTNVESYEQMTVSNVALDAASSINAHNGGTLAGSNRLTLSAGAGIEDGVIVSSEQLTGLTLTNGSNLTLDLSAHGYAAGATDKSIFHIELNDFSWEDLVDSSVTAESYAADHSGASLNDVFKVLALGTTDTFYQVLSVTQGVTTGSGVGITLEVQVPEPTTSVLSLLALAGMAARRRRK